MDQGKRVDIIFLLRDYMNFLPSGHQEAYIPYGGGYAAESAFPLTAESMDRMDKTTEVGETYDKLNRALRALAQVNPKLYNAILVIYLREESGHRDIDVIKRNAAKGNLDAARLLVKHEKAIDCLAHMLRDEVLYVEHPHKATGPKPGQNMEERHDELFRIFMSYYEDEKIPYRQSLSNAVLKMENYYSRRHADRIVKGRLKAIDDER